VRVAHGRCARSRCCRCRAGTPRCDGEIGVPELTLDNQQWDALARHLYRVGVAQLVWGEAAAQSGASGRAVQLNADSGWRPGRPRMGPRRTQNSAPTGSVERSVSHGASCCHAQRSIPTSRRLPPLPRRISTVPRSASRSLSVNARASLIRSPARHSTMIRPRSRIPSASSPAAHHGDDLLDRRRVGRILQPLVARGSSLVITGQGRC
jgi:hypothetical protein